MRLGLHISDFSWPGGPQQIGPVLAEVAQQAEAAGFDRITVMDHLWQIGAVGPPEAPMLEAYTTLGYLAAKTSTITLHAMVTAAVFRAPGLLSKAVTTLDVLSGGRSMLGLGAAWYEEEAVGLGLPFPPLGERMERVEEVVQVCLQMWSGSQDPFTGKHYQLERTLNSPMPVSQPRPRIMIAGSGERKTLRMVAKYADACNIYTGQDIAAKLRVLREHCDREGRDYDQIEKTSTMLFDVGADGSRAGDLLAQLRALHEDGITVVYGRMTAEGYQRQLGVIAREVIPVIADW
jgi:F420-dependent oxidoreductase-like protein